MKFGVGQSVLRKEDDPLLRGARPLCRRRRAGRRAAGRGGALAARACALPARCRRRRAAMPGVRLVLTGEDIDGPRPDAVQAGVPGVDIRCRPIRCWRATRCAMSATRSPSWSPTRSIRRATPPRRSISNGSALPHVVGAAAALEKGAPLVWPDRPGNLAFEVTLGDAARDRPRRSRRRARIVSLKLVNQRLVTNYLDTRGVDRRIRRGAGSPHADARQPGQPRHPRHAVRDARSLPPDKMRVITPDVGGGFGTKLFSYREYALAAVAAKQLKRPVKWIADRTEHFLGDTQGRDNITTAKLALDDKGRFLALDVDTIADMGAYLSTYAPYIPYLGAGMPPGVYDIPALLHPRARGLYQHRAGRCLSRRRAAGGVLRDRAAGRCRRARTRRRAGRAAAAEFHQAEGDAVHDRDRQGLRHRRIRRPHGARAGGRRLGRLQEARRRARKQQGSCAASGLRPISRPAAATARTPRR